jgi:hypothetical protein
LLAANLTPIAIKMLSQRSAAQRSASPRNHQLSQQASSVPCGDMLLKSPGLAHLNFMLLASKNGGEISQAQIKDCGGLCLTILLI